MASISRVVCAALLLSQVLAREACAAQDPLCKDAEPGMSYLLQRDKAKAVKDETALAKEIPIKAEMPKQQKDDDDDYSAQEQQNRTVQQVQKEKHEQVAQKEGKTSEEQARQKSSADSEGNKSAWGFGGGDSSSSTSSVPAGCPGPSVGGYIWGSVFGKGGDDPACCYGNVFQSVSGSLGLTGGPCTNPGKTAGGKGEDCPFGAVCTAMFTIPGMGQKAVYGYCKCTFGQCSSNGESCQMSR